jgi:GMP synthase-like glutamine amidotransferase
VTSSVPVAAGQPVVLAIQNDPTGPPLLVGEWLAEHGIRVEVIQACFGEPVPDAVPDGVNGLLPLGGAMGANDDADAPWLVQERALLADAVERGIPVLGLCLGGQLLAAATGGSVALGPVTEIGVVQVRRTVDGLLDPVLSQAVPAAGADIPAAQWHQDHITELPDGAVLLLTNEACRVQGFRLGDTAYGLQLHPEVDAGTFADWAGMVDEALDRSGLDPQVVTADVAAAEHDLIAAWRPMTRAWGDLVWAHAKDAVATSSPS